MAAAAAAGALFFEYGIVVLFGMPSEAHERALLADVLALAAPAAVLGPYPPQKWMVETCAFEIDPYATQPTVQNDFFTLNTASPRVKVCSCSPIPLTSSSIEELKGVRLRSHMR